MAKIALASDTTENWGKVSRILLEREIAIERATREDGTGYIIIHQGDGTKSVLESDVIFDQSAYEDALAETQENMQKVNAFADNMESATASANSSAAKADTATAEAKAAAKACEGIVDGLNTMVDTVTNKSCVLTIEDGIICVREA
jgi:hypothetical protein